MTTPNYIHKGLLESRRWFQFTLFEQMANIGMDIERTIRWRDKGEAAESQRAFERALKLIDFTKLDPKNRGGALRELCRVREALIDHFVYDNQYQTTDEIWQKYFYAFNYAAAVARGK
jgi:hypothetical protein